MVENVKEFETDIESEIFFNGSSLRDTEISVVKTGTVEEAPIGGSNAPEHSPEGSVVFGPNRH